MATLKEILNYFEEHKFTTIINQADLNQVITGPKNIWEAEKDNLTFLNRKLEKDIGKIMKTTHAALILIETNLFDNYLQSGLPDKIAFVVSENPKGDLIDAVTHFFSKQDSLPQIHPTVIIGKNVKLGHNISAGAYVVIEDNVEIGNGCIIDPNTIIKEGTIIGNNVRIKSCAVIGGVGFGYEKNEKDDTYRFLPHFGRVIIEDNVHIGSNTCIDRGSLSDTIIKKGVKIDNLVHIAHNVSIGENSLIIACSMVAGSVIIGNNCWVAPSASIMNGIKIGDHSVVGLGSVLTNDIENNSTVLGVPAISLEDFKILREQQKQYVKSKKSGLTN
jgi:UDP-3-O-[3-hydroxymyristoyl] glucosamine N-acyltransferase